MASLTAAVTPLSDWVMLHKHFLRIDGVELRGVCVDIDFRCLVLIGPLRGGGGDGNGFRSLAPPASPRRVRQGSLLLRCLASPFPQRVIFSVSGDLRLGLSLGDATPSSLRPLRRRLGLLGSWRAVGGGGGGCLHGLGWCR